MSLTWMRPRPWRTLLTGVLAVILAACGADSVTNPTDARTPPSTAPPAPAIVVSEVRIDASFTGGMTVEGVVTLSGPAPSGSVVVSLASDNASASVPASVVIAAGATSGTFQVVSSVVKRTTEVTITARTADVTKSTIIRLRFDPTNLTPTSSATIAFGNIGAALLTKYEESGFTVATVLGNWVGLLTYGNPAPFMQFSSAAGVTTTGEIRITADGAPLWLTSVDLYSSTTPIPYVLEGFRGDQSVFSVSGTLPNTFGRFANVANARADVPIDALVIRVTNSAAPCCGNPMGVDNIALRR